MNPFLQRCILMLVAACCLAACARDPVDLMVPLASDAVILAFGDSLTYGTGVKEEESYPAQLEKLINRQVVNAGDPGEVTAEGRRRLPEVVARVGPDLIILCLGGNDLLRKLGEQQMVDNLSAMIEWIQERQIPLILMAVPEMKLFGSSHPAYQRLAEHFGIPLEKHILVEVLRQGDLKSDHIHPNARGYRRIAEALAKKLRDGGAL